MTNEQLEVRRRLGIRDRDFEPEIDKRIIEIFTSNNPRYGGQLKIYNIVDDLRKELQLK